MFVKTRRIKNKSLMASYKDKRCLVCNRVNIQSCAAHVKSQGSGGDDKPENMMPLCLRHHQESHTIGIITFAEKYERVMMWLLAHGWIIVDLFGKKKLLKDQSGN